MGREAEFFIYLIERYAVAKDMRASEVLRLWDSLDLTNFIFDMYEIYHIERLQNAFDDIDVLMDEKRQELEGRIWV